MDFLIDYLPAIQFAAALNIGYVIPDILSKIYKTLANIDASYKQILNEVRNKIIVKQNEIDYIHVVETVDDHSTKESIEKLSNKLDSIKENCDNNANGIEDTIKRFVGCSGYRSIFLYSAIFSIFSLLIIPFCHQHDSNWMYRCFFYLFNSISFVYIIILFFMVIAKKKDISCQSVLWMFVLFLIISFAIAMVNSGLSTKIIVINSTMESVFSWLAIGVAFIPGVGCLAFLSALIIYTITLAKIYACKADKQFKQIKEAVDKLDEFNKILNGDISII